jgi:hypothetical protein
MRNNNIINKSVTGAGPTYLMTIWEGTVAALATKIYKKKL